MDRVAENIKMFLSSICSSQKSCLLAGQPCEGTRILLKDLLQSVSEHYTSVVLEKVIKKRIATGDVEPIVGNHLAETFGETLGFTGTFQSEIWDDLKESVVKLVTQKARCHRLALQDPFLVCAGDNYHIDTLIQHTVRWLKAGHDSHLQTSEVFSEQSEASGSHMNASQEAEVEALKPQSEVPAAEAPLQLSEAESKTPEKKKSFWKRARHFLGLRKPKSWKKN